MMAVQAFPIVAMGEALTGNTAWLVSHTLDSAKAFFDSLIEAIEDTEYPKRATE